MVRKFLILASAEEEMRVAKEWYQHIHQELVKELELSIEHAFQRMMQYPLSYQIIYGRIRYARLRRFPYNVCYVVDDKYLLVVAFRHNRMDQKKLKELQ